MKKKILITSFDLAIGGVERSLIGLLNQLDYDKYEVDLMLFKHEGEFFRFIPLGPNLLPEIPSYTTFRKSIPEIAKEGLYLIAMTRTLAKYIGNLHGIINKVTEPGYLSIQYGWEMTNKILPKLNKEYDVAIGFLWPHHFIGEKVKARKKIGWIHTDYSNIYVSKRLESRMWEKMDHIVAVSDECLQTFMNKFPEFRSKGTVIENILSPSFIKEQANVEISREIKKKEGQTTTIVTVGRLSHAKGLDKAAKACKTLIDNGYQIEWYIIGYGPLEKELKKLIGDLKIENNFFLLGKKTNPYPYIKACDIYVQPSRYEGKAVTIREAQIIGKPVIMTNFPTAKSQATEGVDALITTQSIQGIVEGIKKLIDNPRLRKELESNVIKMDFGNENEIHKLYDLIES